MLQLYTPLNTFTLSDALCITITHTQPRMRPWVDFYVHVNVGCSGSRWQPNSRAGPPHCWGPPFVQADKQRSDWGKMSGNPPRTLRFLGNMKRFVQGIQLWQSFPCSALQRVFVEVMDKETLYLFHLCKHNGYQTSLGPFNGTKTTSRVLNAPHNPGEEQRKRQETGV